MTEKNKTPKLISKHEFYFSMPLYEQLPISDYEDYLFSGTVNGYNHYEGCDTTFDIESEFVQGYGNLSDYRVITLRCKRFEKTTFEYFVFDINLDGIRYITKIGQFPSLADVNENEAEIKYSKKINNEHLSLFKKAVGLASHGIGAGSFVYLRKIFEDTINSTYFENKGSVDVSESDFRLMKMSNKISNLSDYLPEEMSEFKGLYSILSNGVHAMSEEDCKKYFPSLKLAIEIIWDSQIEKKEKNERKANVKKQLGQISKEINS